MAISFYDVDTAFIVTERRSATVEALKARKAAPKRRAERVYLRRIFTECGVLMLGALLAAFVA